MTQPPPPPNQPPGPPPNQPPQPPAQPPQDTPPQGGFGAPTPPPAGGFGAPTPPPQGPPPAQGPGYGYPQTHPPAGPPQTPPPAQGPGYGYPQTPPPQPGYGYPGQPGQPGQPGPYGQPQPGPYGQQPYGQPGQPYGYQPPTMAMQPQVPGGKKKVNSTAIIITAAVTAIALIVGGGVLYATSKGGDDDKKNTASSEGTTGGKDDPKGTDGGTSSTGGGSSSGGVEIPAEAQEKVPSSTDAKLLFQIPAPEVKERSTVSVSGSWLTDKVYAKSGIAKIVGYDPDKGSQQWTVKLPGPVCSASRHVTQDNKTAIVYEPAMPTKEVPSHGCTEVAVIDLDAGRKLWTKSVRLGDEKIPLNNVTISGGAVAGGGISGGAAFDVSSGDTLWSPKASATCYDAGYAGGAALVAVRKCGDYGDQQLHIQTLDPKSGTVLSEYKLARGIKYASVVSTKPLVVAADVGESAKDGSGISDFFSIDERTGKLRTKITAQSDRYAARCEGIRVIEGCSQLAVGNGKLYVPTEERDGTAKYTQTNEIVAFDLVTGKQTGERADAGDGYTISPLRMDGPNIIAYKRPPYDKGGQIVSIDGKSFTETKLLENPASDSVRSIETGFLPDYSEILYGSGRLFMSQVYASEPYSDDDKEYLAIAFGAK
ncbi:PQQ-binding-like beta-propeller repeat protein [Streptomyces ossamyceticus]|nr:PQQ-binding-like beta-propeller repeat protein [Streptomyces ossamyceticus]